MITLLVLITCTSMHFAAGLELGVKHTQVYQVLPHCMFLRAVEGIVIQRMKKRYW